MLVAVTIAVAPTAVVRSNVVALVMAAIRAPAGTFVPVTVIPTLRSAVAATVTETKPVAVPPVVAFCAGREAMLTPVAPAAALPPKALVVVASMMPPLATRPAGASFNVPEMVRVPPLPVMVPVVVTVPERISEPAFAVMGVVPEIVPESVSEPAFWKIPPVEEMLPEWTIVPVPAFTRPRPVPVVALVTTRSVAAAPSSTLKVMAPAVDCNAPPPTN